jgi:Tfp pilus assembly protein PilN
MRAVNLLPPKQGRAASAGSLREGRRPVVILGVAALVAGLGWWGWQARSEAQSLAEQVTAAQAEQAAVQAQVTQMLTVDTRMAAQVARRGVIVSLAAGRINWERLMRDSVTVLPRGVWVTEVTATAPAAATAATAATPAAATTGQAVTTAPQGLHVEGFAMTQTQVARLLARLDAVSGLGEPRLASAETIVRAQKKVVQFVIDVPVDQRAQDRPTLQVVSGSSAAAGTAGQEGG